MKAAMMSGSNMGSFGMMGLMSALMGNLNMQSRVGHLDHTSSKIVNKTNSQEPEISRTDDKVVQEKFDTHIKSSQEKSPDDLENSDNTKETKTHGQLPGSDILTSLMNGTETAQGDVGMFSMLKDICSKVSSERTTVNDKATDRLVVS
jgi:hypothetical protein